MASKKLRNSLLYLAFCAAVAGIGVMVMKDLDGAYAKQNIQTQPPASAQKSY